MRSMALSVRATRSDALIESRGRARALFGRREPEPAANAITMGGIDARTDQRSFGGPHVRRPP
jgi:hypothetical protein